MENWKCKCGMGWSKWDSECSRCGYVKKFAASRILFYETLIAEYVDNAIYNEMVRMWGK